MSGIRQILDAGADDAILAEVPSVTATAPGNPKADMRYRLDRALRILRLLHSQQRYDPVKLAIQLQVNRRTIYRDIALLREMGIEIIFDHENRYYLIERLDQAHQRDESASKLRGAMERAMTDVSSETSVEAIIRHVAMVLTDASHDAASNLSRRPPAPVAVSRPPFSGAPHPPAKEARPLPAAADGLLSPDQTISTSAGREWQITRQSLAMLTHAIDNGFMIETSESDPAQAESLNSLAQQIRPTEFTVNRDEVIISGLDARGNQIRSTSHTIRLIELGYRGRTTARRPHSWH